MKLGQLLGAYQSELKITPRHEEWLRTNPNASYTELAREFLGTEIGKPQRDRTNTFSASGQGQCPRRRQFAFLGMPEGSHFNSRTISIFHNGVWTHLRWQLAGLSAGWLVHAEVPARDDVLMLTGTLDGITDDGWGVEIKSINSNGYNRVFTYGIKVEHKAQADAYLLMTDLPGFCFIYENKDTQDYREIVYHRDEEALKIIRAAQQRLAEATHARVLFGVKGACEEQTGTEYLQCPFRSTCLSVRNWTHAEQVRDQMKEEACTSGEPSIVPRTLRLRRTSSSPSD